MSFVSVLYQSFFLSSFYRTAKLLIWWPIKLYDYMFNVHKDDHNDNPIHKTSSHSFQFGSMIFPAFVILFDWYNAWYGDIQHWALKCCCCEGFISVAYFSVLIDYDLVSPEKYYLPIFMRPFFVSSSKLSSLPLRGLSIMLLSSRSHLAWRNEKTSTEWMPIGWTFFARKYVNFPAYFLFHPSSVWSVIAQIFYLRCYSW